MILLKNKNCKNQNFFRLFQKPDTGEIDCILYVVCDGNGQQNKYLLHIYRYFNINNINMVILLYLSDKIIGNNKVLRINIYC